MNIWTEKYRPKKLSEVKGQEEITKRLSSFVESKNMPHMLFTGPAGVGKTTCALAIASELYGTEWRDYVLELNASDDRGIDIVRNQIKDFARTKAVSEVPFKIIYLDEADHLTKDAQAALRRTMEDYTSTTRFILSCNYSSKIISPIQSRCAVFRFAPLPKEDVFKLLSNICKEEGHTVSLDALELVYLASEGDMRKAENLMQACASVGKEINLDVVKQVVSFAEPSEIKMILNYCLKGDFINARLRLHDVMLKHGLSGMDVVKQIQSRIWDMDISDEIKMKWITLCGEYEFRMVEGSNEFIQLTAMVAEFCK